MAEALLAAARTRAKAVLAKMRSKRGPLIRTLSQKFPRTRVTCEPPLQIKLRHPTANLTWIRQSRQQRTQSLRVILVDFGPLSPACHVRSNFFSGSVTGLQRRRFRKRDFGIEPERIELAVKCRAPDAQPPRDLGHLTAVMAYGESDGLGFDVRKRAHMAASVEQRERASGRRGGCCRDGRYQGRRVGVGAGRRVFG